MNHAPLIYTPTVAPVIVHAECWTPHPREWLMLVIATMVQRGTIAHPECVRVLEGADLLDVDASEGEVDIWLEVLAEIPDDGTPPHRNVHTDVSTPIGGRAKASGRLPAQALLSDRGKVDWLYS